MITIRRIHQGDVPAVKHIIHTVAFTIFGFDGTLEDSIRHYESLGIFRDLEDVQAHYFENGGIFLVALLDDRVIGAGAIRRLDDHTAELKRMWLLEPYHGQGIGYRLITDLIAFARAQGYARIRLQTSPEQTRALGFYRKVGFYEIPNYTGEPGEISMELSLDET